MTVGFTDQSLEDELPAAGTRSASAADLLQERWRHRPGSAPAKLHTPDSTIDGALEHATSDLLRTDDEDPAAMLVADAALAALGKLPLGAEDPVRRRLEQLLDHRRPDGSLPGRLPLDRVDAEPGRAVEDPAATPAWVVALYEYWLQTADTAFVRTAWPALLGAYRWGLAHDRDADLILDRDPAGPGPIGALPAPDGSRQDIGLAAVWLESLRATSDLAGARGDLRTARAVAQNFERAWSALERRYYRSESGRYGSEPAPGDGPGSTLTAAPGVTALAFSLLDTDRVPNTLDVLASHRLMTDWGSRTLESDHPRYDPMAVRAGAVTPAMTGLAAWGLYNYHRPHAGFTALQAIARSLYGGEDGHGAIALSGARFVPLDPAKRPARAAASAIFVAALFRGLLGLQADAPRNGLTFAPHLPADWDSLGLAGYAIGGSRIDLIITRDRTGPSGDVVLSARFRRAGGDRPLSLRFAPGLPPGSSVRQVRIDGVVQDHFEWNLEFDDPHVVVRFRLERETEVVVLYRPGVGVIPPRPEPASGEAASAVRILSYDHDSEADRYRLRLEGPGGSTRHLDLVSPRGAPIPLTSDEVRAISRDRFRLQVTFDGPPDTYVHREVRLQGPAP